MLDVVRPETRVYERSHPARWQWGIVDGILGFIMLPFGVWLLLIEGLVNGATWLFNLPSAPRTSARD